MLSVSESYIIIPFLVGACCGIPLTFCLGVRAERQAERARALRSANDQLDAAVRRLEHARGRLANAFPGTTIPPAILLADNRIDDDNQLSRII